jgi:uncharacterized protein with HEPN domain
MKKDFRDYIADILNAIQEVEEFTRGMNFNTFLKDKKTINAVIRSLEVMGEAAKRIPEDVKEQYSDIPWKRMAGMRDKLIHEYSGVDLEIVWLVIKEEVPPIKPLIEKLFNDMGKGD